MLTLYRLGNGHDWTGLQQEVSWQDTGRLYLLLISISYGPLLANRFLLGLFEGTFQALLTIHSLNNP